MKRFNTFLTLGASAIVALSSCSTSYNAMQGESDDLYFMASDARLATEFAVNNNNAQNFRALSETSSDQFEQENFSARNVNPEYIAKYQADSNVNNDEAVYFDDNQVAAGGDPNINVYNNYYSNAGGNFNTFGGPMMSPWMMGGFSPWGMGMGMYDPFWGPGFGMGMMPGMGFGFRPGFNMSIGFGFGGGFGWGNPWMMRRGFGMGGFYDPFFDPFWPGMGFAGGGWGWGAPGWGWGGRPIYVIPGNEFGNRQIVRGARPTRGSSLAATGARSRTSNVAAAPSSSRAAARRDATGTSRTGTSVANSSRNSRADFGRSQNDYYNNSRAGSTATTRSAAPSSRNTRSAVMDRGASRVGSSSAAPSYRNAAPSNTRSRVGSTAAPSRSTASPSYNNSRSTAPSRNTYSQPARTSTPSRSTYSAPSRSTGGSVGGGSVGGGSRGGGASSGGSSRGGRGG
ncbi:hypothetical protein MM239_06600 [Belliella sp. DSM 111904]|uniref:Uncharacterized protein n=1 Tax=Belliella filtrata TaxID=2923435 RepID=A0ABS9UY06_9BACT|nr:hypothetical protein [Belliella filtrata]MCH7409056.1 hypothetical protein [Belliella filtrata]